MLASVKKQSSMLCVGLWLLVSPFSVLAVFGQFPKRLPDILKAKPKATPPKQEPPDVENTRPTPKPGAGGAIGSAQPENAAGRSSRHGSVRLARPQPTDKPVFLLNSLEIKCRTRETYWKFPNQNDYSSWIPEVDFDVFYDDSARLGYVVEFFHPDGSPWFSETLRQGFLSNDKTVAFQSDNSGELLNTKAVTTTGIYAFKITNSKTNEVVFRGEFKVGKFKSKSSEPRYKNHFDFYVEHDWLLPIGHLGFESSTSWESPMPTIYLWFKGDVEEKELEARLYFNGQVIATTDTPQQSDINEGGKRFSSSESSPGLHQWRLWEFTWFNFRVENGSRYIRQLKPNVKFTEDMPGEYTVKVFRKGVQVREAKFSVGPDGLFVDGGFAGQINLINYGVILPVKVMGTLDKWDAAAWRTDAFYGNPLAGFKAP